MSRAGARGGRTGHEADPWWGGEPAVDVMAGQGAAVEAPLRPVRRRRPTGAARRSLPIALMNGLLRVAVRRVSDSPRLRRLGIRSLVFIASALLITSAVGVIMLNNVVIRRSAELGELDQRRGELRTENAVLGAKSAVLSAPPRITARAKAIGMARAPEMPIFIYLDQSNQPVTPAMRRRSELRQQRRQREQQARRAAEAAAAAESANVIDPVEPTTSEAGR